MKRKANKKDIPKLFKLFNSDSNLTGNDNLCYTKNIIEEYVTNPVNKLFVYMVGKKIAGAILVEFWKKNGF